MPRRLFPLKSIARSRAMHPSIAAGRRALRGARPAAKMSGFPITTPMRAIQTQLGMTSRAPFGRSVGRSSGSLHGMTMRNWTAADALRNEVFMATRAEPGGGLWPADIYNMRRFGRR